MGLASRAGRRRGGVLAGVLAVALAMTVASVAWACTIVPEPYHTQIHELLPVPHSAAGTSVPVSLEALGVPLPQNPSPTYNVLQDNDGTVAAGKSASTPTSCAGDPDPIVGSISYDSQNKGTGTATLQAFKGPGMYEICAGPDPSKIKGYFTFM